MIALAPQAGFAQSNVEGYVYGTAKAGSEVRIENTETGYARNATVQSNGSFRTPSVPPGTYKVTYTDSSGATATREVTVSIGGGTSIETANLETVVVTGQTIPQVDMTNTESVTILSAERIEQLPIARDIQQVALLAPGTVQGDEGFLSQSGKALISFSGASPGENTYYINGMNVTDFRNFLGGATVPFEFYDQFELRTGGYSAEFGRSLGGVINAVSKRGTNEFKYGVSTYWQPESLAAHRPDVWVTDSAGVKTQRYDNANDYNSEFQLNVEAGGPIIEDKLFFYALGVMRDIRDDDPVGTSAYSRTGDDSPFFGGKLDWQISDDHALEYTYMRDDSTMDVETYSYSPGQMGALRAIGTRDEGGTTHIFRYSGSVTESLAVSALYGLQDRRQANVNRDAVTGLPCVFINDARGSTVNPLSCWDSTGTGQIADTTDERDAYRVDMTYFIGSHAIKLGYDFEKDTSDTDVVYEGGVGYRYINSTPGATLNQGIIPDGVTNVARERFYSITGTFEQKLSAVYLEDSWQATDRLLLSLGLRNETLENFNKNGEEFLDFGDQLTPRLGFSFDLRGDGKTKVFGNAGRYTMPIATNTNIRFAGGEFFTEQYYALQGVNADGTPILGAPIGILRTLSDGTVPVPAQSVDSEIKPMYQDEFILGIQSALTDRTTLGLKVTHRDLVQAVEDSAFVDANGNFYYFLFNPGRSVRLQNPDGTYTVISADELGYPEAKRKHWAAQFTFDQRFGDSFRLSGSYTWSHTYGNFEGAFQSDVQQDDAGITINFDTPGLALFTNGDLPNDRRHVLKTYGTYAPTENLTLSMNLSVASGRPKNARGNCPTDVDPDAYAQDCFYVLGVPTPRGSAGRLPWVYSLDMGVQYRPAFYDKVLVGMDVTNIFNFDRPTRITETAQQAGDEDAPVDPAYGTARYFQDPRAVRLSARWDFK